MRRLNRLSLLLVLLLALAPRLLLTGNFWTTDEARHWVGRSAAFLQAVQQGDYARTSLTGHPGVTTMWLGALGIAAYQGMVRQGQVAPIEPAFAAVEQGDYGQAAAVYSATPADFALFRNLTRLPLALVTGVGVVLAYLLLRRLFAARVALLAALFVAADPFLVAHSRLLHLDALLTTFMLLALLAALLAFRLESSDASALPVRWPLLAASAGAGGLALLTKSPSVLLVPMVGFIALVSAARGIGSWFPALRSRLLACLAWGVVAAGVCVLLWPALWVDLPGTVATVVREARENGGAPHPDGTFFLGRVVGDPGPLFYPIALVLRLTPWVMIGLFALLWRVPHRSESRVTQPSIALLVLFVLLFLLLLSLPPKKFDRYILPVFPLLDILAAVGWMQLWDRMAGTRQEEPEKRVLAQRVALSAVCIVLAANIAWYHPYQLAYYNPLPGGGRTAARTMYVGWGEGLEQAGAYIRAQPDGCDYAVASWYQEVLLPYVCSPVMELAWADAPEHVNYVVFYVNQLQRNIYGDVAARVQSQGAPVHTVRIHSIDYAYVYQLARPVAHSISANFGGAIHMTGYELDTGSVRTTGLLTLTTQWQAHAPLDDDYMLFVHVLNQQGQRTDQVDVPPGGPAVPTSAWQPGHFYTWSHPVPIGADVPAGRYWLALGIYHPDSFSRLPLSQSEQRTQQQDAPAYDSAALLLGPAIIDAEE